MMKLGDAALAVAVVVNDVDVVFVAVEVVVKPLDLVAVVVVVKPLDLVAAAVVVAVAGTDSVIFHCCCHLYFLLL
jgi:hypothetical protein